MEDINQTSQQGSAADIGDFIYCRGCGTKIHKSAVHCVTCGAVQRSVSNKSRNVAILLAFFLGGLGAHKFYLGQPGRGILYALFCWTFIPALLALISFFRMIFMSDEDFSERYK